MSNLSSIPTPGVARRSPVVTALLSIAILLVLASPVAAATSSSAALTIARYAVATASHERPARVVTAADVSNAVSITSVNPRDLILEFNLDVVFGFGRTILLIDQHTFANTCLDLPNAIGAAPKIIPCTAQAVGQWQSRSSALQLSGRAIAAAAARGRAVSGADIVRTNAAWHLHLVPAPTFAAGQGGTVKFASKVSFQGQPAITIDICVKMPRTAYGIAVQVAC
ncbi:MAG TPA: hypothetical protein VMV96_01460 [Acidimicrobiales bacterium]|nr:hypothetical protein [Acidimicrobiales bacterium]